MSIKYLESFLIYVQACWELAEIVVSEADTLRAAYELGTDPFEGVDHLVVHH